MQRGWFTILLFPGTLSMKISTSLLFSHIIQNSGDAASSDLRTLAPCSLLYERSSMWTSRSPGQQARSQKSRDQASFQLLLMLQAILLSYFFLIFVLEEEENMLLFYPMGSHRVTSNINMMMSVISVDSFLTFSSLCIYDEDGEKCI